MKVYQAPIFERRQLERFVEGSGGIRYRRRILGRIRGSRQESVCTATILTVYLQNNITACSDLAVKSDYHLFKKGVRPEWEDIQNKHGGKWSYSFKDKKLTNINELWLHTQLAAIGETLEGDGDNEIMGVVVNVRKGFYRVGLWTRTTGKAGGKDVLIKIGERFKEVLQLPSGEQLEFSGHTDAAHAGSTRAKAKYTV